MFGRNDDDVVLLVRAHFTQDVRDGYSMLLADLSSLLGDIRPHLALARMWRTARLAPSAL